MDKNSPKNPENIDQSIKEKNRLKIHQKNSGKKSMKNIEQKKWTKNRTEKID